MGTKYIIEVEDKPFEMLNEGGFTSKKLFKVKGFNSLVFDWNGLNKLTPYTEPDLDAIRNEAYEKGVQDTKQNWVDAPRSCAYKLGYENGLNDLWEAVNKIADMPYKEAEKEFGSAGWSFVKKHTASEAIAKIKALEEKQEELHIGDVVTFKTAHGRDTGIVVECHVPDVYPDVDKYIVWCGGRVEYLVKEWLTKTGVHFSEITSILQKIKEMKKE